MLGSGWAPSMTITGSCWPGCWPALTPSTPTFTDATLLADQYPNEQDLAAVQVGKAVAPMGKPRVASEMPWPIVSGTATAP